MYVKFYCDACKHQKGWTVENTVKIYYFWNRPIYEILEDISSYMYIPTSILGAILAVPLSLSLLMCYLLSLLTHQNLTFYYLSAALSLNA